MFSPGRNQSTDLECKALNLCLYKGNSILKNVTSQSFQKYSLLTSKNNNDNNNMKCNHEINKNTV